MKGDRIPDADHAARYCRSGTVDGGEILATAFQLKSEETFLSINWLELLNQGNRADEIKGIREVLSRKLSIGKNAKIAVLNVGKTREYVLSESLDRRDLSFCHEPEEIDESHGGIYNTKPDVDMLIAELIVETVIGDYPAH